MTPCPPILNRSTTTRIPLTPQQTTHSLSSSKWTSETFPSAVTMVLRTLMSTHLRHSRSRPTPPPLVLCLLLPLAVRKFPNIIRISNVNNTTITTTTPIPSPTIIVRVTPTTVLPPVTRRRRTTTANSAITLQPWRSPPSHPHTSIPNCRWSPPSLCPVPLWMTPTAETPARSTSALPVLVVSILLNLLSSLLMSYPQLSLEPTISRLTWPPMTPTDSSPTCAPTDLVAAHSVASTISAVTSSVSIVTTRSALRNTLRLRRNPSVSRKAPVAGVRGVGKVG